MISDQNLTKMTIQDPGFENNVINFFGDEAVAKKYLALEKIEEKIKLIWTAPIIQVKLNK